MARLPRLCIPGWPHLLVQLGHNHQPVFRDDVDRKFFLALLHAATTQHGVALHAYGLRDNEVRLLATPTAQDSLSLVMQAVGRRYGSNFNRRHGHSGSVWEGRFRATVIEPERHLLRCMRYAEQPATEGESGAGPWENMWSSSSHHLGARTDALISDPLQYWALGNTPFEREVAYREIWQQALTSQEISAFAEAAKGGWPLGSPEFLATLASNTQRRISPLARGRPRKVVLE